MGTGYTRQDTANNIAPNKIASAADIDNEFDAIVDAFDEATGHTHDGTADEGAPIELTGPNQEYVSTASALYPKTDDTYDLGATNNQWKDLYLDGVAYVDSLQVDTLEDSVDATKKLAFDLSGIGTTTTRTLTVPDATDTLALLAETQTLTNKTIDSASNTLTLDLSEGTLTGTTAEFNTALSDDNFATLAGTETFSNKTLISPTVTGLDIDDDEFTISDNLDGTKQVAFQVSGVTTATTRTLTVPDESTTIVGTDATQTLTNKTLAFGSNTVSGTLAQFNTAVTDATLASLTGSETLTNKTLTSPDINTPDIDGGTIDGTTIGGTTAAAGSFTTLTASGDVAFDTDGFFFDESTGRVGIGTSSPSSIMHLAGDDPKLYFEDNAGLANDDYSISVAGSFLTIRDETNARDCIIVKDTQLEFYTSGSAGMFIDAGGNVGINGITTPDAPLHVGLGTGTVPTINGDTVALFQNNAAGGDSAFISILAASTDTAGIYFGDFSSQAQGGILYNNSNDSLAFTTSNSEAMRIDPSGNVGIGTSSPSQALDVVGAIETSGGIYLGGTGSANLLDDYEEGTWTPELQDSGNSPVTLTVDDGAYRKVGSQVTLWFSVAAASLSDGAYYQLANLPFLPNSFYGIDSMTGAACSSVGANSNAREVFAIAGDLGGGTKILIRVQQDDNFSNTDRIDGFCTYFV